MRNHRGLIVTAAVFLLLSLCSLIFALRCRSYTGMLISQQAAERWQGDSELRFAQISCFRPVGQEVDLSRIEAFRAGLDDALSGAALESADGVNLWVDAYSSLTTLRVQGEKSAIDADAYAVGGEFFFFHPLKLVSGSYLSENDLSRDRVVLTRELAWALFGAVDVAGMEVLVDGEPYLVAGVVDADDDAASEAARAGGMAIYLHHDQVYAYGDAVISCYELVLADPISDFAKNVVQERFPELGEVVENSRRYELSRLWQLISRFGSRSMNVSGILYPTWENAARYTEDFAALYLLLCLLTGLLPLCLLLVVSVIAVRKLKVQGKRVANRLLDRWN